MSNELKKLVKEIQFKTDKTIEEIADEIGYSRAYFNNQVNRGTNKALLKALQDKFMLEIEHNVPREIKDPDPDLVVQKGDTVYHLEIKTASGKTIKVIPEGKAEIELLNALLEERDKVINTIATEKQARIDELERDKERLFDMVNYRLADIKEDTFLGLSYQKAWVEYMAELEAKGNEKKKHEIMLHMNNLLASKMGVTVEDDKKTDVRK